MPVICKDTSWIIQAAIDQMTPDLDHVCLLPSQTFVKITRIINVVRSETQLRADEGPRCPPGSKDLRHALEDGDATCEPRPARARPRRERSPPAQPRAPKRRPKP